MYRSQSPHMMEVDPYLIRFNEANPRKHKGTELLRLNNNIKEVGMVQFPTVRELYAEFVECIDGEGRVLVARENHEPRIWVVSLGKVSDSEALLMLQAANGVRTFGFLDECRGLANLHRQGFTTVALAEKFGMVLSEVIQMVALGYFPDDLLILIREDMVQSEEHAQRWTKRLLYELLHLRELLPGQDPHHPHDEHGQIILERMYDYKEVRLAVEKVLRGNITNGMDMHVYVAQRRLELFQARFDQELQTRLKAELVQAKQALEENYSEELKRVQQKTVREYEKKLQRLQEERDDLEASYKSAINQVAKQSEQVKQIQEKLQTKIQEVEKRRQDVEALQRKVETEALAKERQLQEEKQRQLKEELERQRVKEQEAYNQMKANLEAHYSSMESKLQLQTETTVHQIIADCARLLNETQLAVLNILSADVFKGVVWLQNSEMMVFVAQIRTVRETLEKAEDQLLHSNVVLSTERRSSDGSQAYH